MGSKTKEEPDIAAADTERTIVYLGNRNAVDRPEDPADIDVANAEGRAPNRLRLPVAGKRCTTVHLAPGMTLLEAAHDITHSTRGVWQAHSDAATPAWVASTDPTLAQLLASHWQCELRDPEPDHVASGDEPGTED